MDDCKRESLVKLTPISHSEIENNFRIDRVNSLLSDAISDNILHVAGGEHSGIVIHKQSSSSITIENGQSDEKLGSYLTLDFIVFLSDATTNLVQQEARTLKFFYDENTPDREKHYSTQEFFKTLVNEFPKDYVNFVKKLLKMMQMGYERLRRIEVAMKIIENDSTVLSPSQGFENSFESDVVNADSVKEVLEHAYPNGMLAENLANALQCSLDEVFEFLNDLKQKHLVTQLESGQWIRADPTTNFEKVVVKQMPKVHEMHQPTVAIITALYVEKLAVDAIIEDKKTFVRYKTDGESNIYTLGKIGCHQVVATKLSASGCTRFASIAAGSVTTRLLGFFQDIQHVLLVGVGGGVSHFTNKDEHVRLGDVVVSCAVHLDGNLNKPYSYVFCEPSPGQNETQTIITNGYNVKYWAPADPVLSDIVQELKRTCEDDRSEIWHQAKLDAEHELQADVQLLDGTDSAATAVASDGVAANATPFDRPSSDTDVLRVALGGGKMATVAHPDPNRRYSRLHAGPVGCGWVSARDAADARTDFAQKFRLKAYDVDMQSVIESILGNRINSWTLVRGISDYGDGCSSKNKEWLPFAALQAAVVAKLLLVNLPSAHSAAGGGGHTTSAAVV